MFLLSPAWQAKLRIARQLQSLLLQAFVIYPALLFFLLFLLMSRDSGSSGQMLLREAERLVRDAPAGQVWDCRSPAQEGRATRQALSLPPQPVTTDNAWPTPVPAVPSCVNVAESREDWVADANHILLSFYEVVVLLSIAASLAVRIFRRRTQGACA
ncbi:hypothetical protein PUG81_27610 [Erwiniaceae bacterium L1_54_6]|nr:hypothetical protein [Erwiniaceae bacterium L1_54_6]